MEVMAEITEISMRIAQDQSVKRAIADQVDAKDDHPAMKDMQNVLSTLKMVLAMGHEERRPTVAHPTKQFASI